MKTLSNLFVVSLLLAGLVGCSGDPDIAASDYEQSCSSDDECERVYEGSVCGCGQVAAIHESAVENFEADKLRMQGRCSSVTECDRAEPLAEVVCSSGTCGTELLDEGERDTGGSSN